MDMEYFEDSSDSHVSSPDCETDSHSDSDSSSANEAPKRKKAKVTTWARFSEAQKACLNSYYLNGMTSTSKKQDLMISKAAKDTDLSVDQVKRWIKKRNYRRNHARPVIADRPIPTKKRPKLSPWQIFLKQYGDSEAGKQAMLSGAANFNKLASTQYKTLDSKDKEALKALSSKTTDCAPMTSKEIKRSASKIFKKIRSQYEELEKIGYRGVAFGFFEEDVQAAYTRDSACAVTPRIIDIVRSVIIAGNLPESTLLDKPDFSSSNILPSSNHSQPTSVSTQPSSSKTHPSSSKTLPSSSKTHPSSQPSSSKTQPSFSKTQPSSRKTRPSSSSKTQPSSNHSQPTSQPSSSKTQPSSKHSQPTSVSTQLSSSKTHPSSSKTLSSSVSTQPTSIETQSASSPTLMKLLSSLPDSNDHSQLSQHCHLQSESATKTIDDVDGQSQNLENIQQSTAHTLHDQSEYLVDPVHDVDLAQVEDDLPGSPVVPNQSSEVVVINSTSPIKDNNNIWIRQYNLSLDDLQVIKNGEWLNDNVIYAAQCLLSEQSEDKIFGWQSTQCSKREELFSAIPPYTPFIQILHVANSHWITTTNISRNGEHHCDTVCIYDSMAVGSSASPSVVRYVCSFFKPPLKCKAIRFDTMNIAYQKNCSDCGLHAIACATELVHGFDPVVSEFDAKNMRPHLIECLENKFMRRFPIVKKRRVPFGSRVRKTVEVKIYCVCRLPNDTAREMIQCVSCQMWFHKDCMSLDVTKSYKREKWMCNECNTLLKNAQS